MRLELGLAGKSTQFVIVNKIDAASAEDQQQLIDRTFMPIFQDVSPTDAWTAMNGAKDDFYIYDRMALLAKHVRQATEPTKLTTQADYDRLKSEILVVEAKQ